MEKSENRQFFYSDSTSQGNQTSADNSGQQPFRIQKNK